MAFLALNDCWNQEVSGAKPLAQTTLSLVVLSHRSEKRVFGSTLRHKLR